MSWWWYCGRLVLVVLIVSIVSPWHWPCVTHHCCCWAMAASLLLWRWWCCGCLAVVLVVLAASLLSLSWCCGNHLIVDIMSPWHLPCASRCHCRAGMATSLSLLLWHWLSLLHHVVNIVFIVVVWTRRRCRLCCHGRRVAVQWPCAHCQCLRHAGMAASSLLSLTSCCWLWPHHCHPVATTTTSSLSALCRRGSGHVWLVVVIVIMVVLATLSSLSLRCSVPDRVSGGGSPW